MMAAKQAEGREITMTRFYDAPREIVFRYWTDPRLVAEWWGPEAFVNENIVWEAVPGGEIRIDMRAPDGSIYPTRGVFHEAVDREKLVFTTGFRDEKTGLFRMEERTTVTFEDADGGTKLTVHSVVVSCAPEWLTALDGMEAGWSQTLERLARVLV
jgi:uncharacterized protein YndB with AHSA1/START domain